MESGVTRKVVLIVDDSEEVATTIKEVLDTEPGLHAVAVLDVSRAFEVLHAMRVNLILSDYKMPGINGLEFFEMLQQDETTSHIPVLFVTGVDGAFLKDTSGVAGYISKPFEIGDLLQTVRRLCREL